jgi:glycosyltransferase involved in cell wall biosynthesis
MNVIEDEVFSLVIPTMNRQNELRNLLTSLAKQTYKNFEIILVDQNTDYAINISEFTSNLNIKTVKPDRKLGASAARNFGAMFASGKYITFPDDDCWYDNKVLESIFSIFNKFESNIVSCLSYDPDQKMYNVQFPERSDYLNFWNIHKGGIEYTVFFERICFNLLKGFDENIGPGANSIFQAGEITNLLFQAYKEKYLIYFTNEIKIFHPYKNIFNSKEVSFEREGFYSAGMGYVFRKNSAIIVFIYSTIRLCQVFLISLFSLNKTLIKTRWIILKFRLIGFFK